MKVMVIFILIVVNLSANAQQFTVSADKMNVLHVGVDNPITPMVENFPCKDILIETNNGMIKKGYDTCQYIVTPDSKEETIIRVFTKTKNGKKLIGEKQFRTRLIPKPTIVLAGKEKGTIRKNMLLAQLGLLIGGDAAHFGFTFTIDGFKVIILRDNSIVFESLCTGAKFSDSIKEGIQKMKAGDKFICEDIKFSGYGYTRELANSIGLKVID